MYYSAGTYESFAHPEKPEGVDKKSAYIIGGGPGGCAGCGFVIRYPITQEGKHTGFAANGLTCVLLSATAFREKDYVRGIAKPTEDLLRACRTVLQNRNFVCFTLGDLFSYVSMAFFQTAMLYYITMLLNVPESPSFLAMAVAPSP